MRFQEPVNILPGTSPWKKSELADSKTENQCTLARAFRGKDVMADFVCHCTSHLYILRGDEEMHDCCLGVSALFFHPSSVTILKKKKTSLHCFAFSLADIVEAVDQDVDVNDKVQAHNALIIDCTK